MLISNPLIERYTRNIYSDQLKHLAYIERSTFLNTVKPFDASDYAQGRLLSFVSKLIRPDVILELGTFTAYGSVCLCEGLSKKGRLMTVESNADLKPLIEDHLAQTNYYDQVEVQYDEALKFLETIDEVIDLVFIDANKRQYEQYYELVLPMMRKGGVVIADNVLWKSEVAEDNQSKMAKALDQFNKTIATDKRVESFILPYRDGLSIMRKI